MTNGLRRALAALALCLAAAAAAAAGDEAGVRAALQRCVDAWNRHEPPAFGACLTEDVWYSEADDSAYKRFQGRAKALDLLDYNIRNSDLQWEVAWIRTLADGTAAVKLKQRVGMLPLKDGQYAMSFDSEPSLARLRRENGVWKLHFFTSHKGWALALIQALDAPPPMAAAAAAPAPAPAALPGAAPPAYTMSFGPWASSCHYCHGLPALSDESTRTRILTEGAQAADGAALRRQMALPRSGGIMDKVLADPALTDDRLESIRRWLVTLRDGRAEWQADRVVIHNPRSDRDPPVRFAVLKAQGWRLPADAGCRVGRPLPGGARCEIRLPAGARGSLEFRFAASPGLQPQPVRVEAPQR